MGFLRGRGGVLGRSFIGELCWEVWDDGWEKGGVGWSCFWAGSDGSFWGLWSLGDLMVNIPCIIFQFG